MKATKKMRELNRNFLGFGLLMGGIGAAMANPILIAFALFCIVSALILIWRDS